MTQRITIHESMNASYVPFFVAMLPVPQELYDDQDKRKVADGALQRTNKAIEGRVHAHDFADPVFRMRNYYVASTKKEVVRDMLTDVSKAYGLDVKFFSS